MDAVSRSRKDNRVVGLIWGAAVHCRFGFAGARPPLKRVLVDELKKSRSAARKSGNELPHAKSSEYAM
jgi:hypothetical protein